MAVIVLLRDFPGFTIRLPHEFEGCPTPANGSDAAEHWDLGQATGPRGRWEDFLQ
jgi:hypothetical protein